MDGGSTHVYVTKQLILTAGSIHTARYRSFLESDPKRCSTVLSLLLPKIFREVGKEVRLPLAEGQKLLREEGPQDYRNVSDDEDMSMPQEKAFGELIRNRSARISTFWINSQRARGHCIPR